MGFRCLALLGSLQQSYCPSYKRVELARPQYKIEHDCYGCQNEKPVPHGSFPQKPRSNDMTRFGIIDTAKREPLLLLGFPRVAVNPEVHKGSERPTARSCGYEGPRARPAHRRFRNKAAEDVLLGCYNRGPSIITEHGIHETVH